MTRDTISLILDNLRYCYGRRTLHPHNDPVSELILTILSQNTSDTNSRPAFESLKSAFSRFDLIIDADVEQIAVPIKRSGLGMIKAERIKSALTTIKEMRGSLDLLFLAEMPVPKAREWLTRLPGIGNKTAGCVLLFALGRPALPVDTHIFRLSKRLGLIDQKADLEQAHRLLEDMVPDEDIYEFHVLMIEHGRKTCTARNPHCDTCPLKKSCPGFNKYKNR